MSENKRNQKLIFSHSDLFRLIYTDFLPTALTTTILAPFNRAKILLQNMKLISINDELKTYRPINLFPSIVYINNIKLEIIKEQGLFALWRGNVANLYKLIFQSFTNIYFNTKIQNYYNNKNKNKINFIQRLYTSCLTSTLSLLFSYPFELASTRISCDMTRYGHKRIYSSIGELFSKTMEEESKIILYKRIY
jgi:solute carrier family 25 (adenine nucleotide translocator) protein 4/5/6/31